MIDNLRKRYEQLQGLLNTPNNQGGGLLGNIPQTALLGSAIYGQGVQGKDPFSALLPAVTQTAQLQKLMTPKKGRLIAAYDPEKKEVVYEYEKDIKAKGLKPVPKEIQGTAAERNYKTLLDITKNGTEQEINVAKMVFGKQGREPMSKEEFLGKVTTNLSKDALADPDDIQKILPKWESIYDNIFKVSESVSQTTSQMTETPEGFKGSLEQWNILKEKNKNASDKELVDFFNKKYGG